MKLKSICEKNGWWQEKHFLSSLKLFKSIICLLFSTTDWFKWLKISVENSLKVNWNEMVINAMKKVWIIQ